MRTMKLMTAAMVVGLAAAALVQAKSSTPMLTIKPLNQEGDPYCVTCQAGRNPAVVAFVTQNDEPTQQLLTELGAQAKAGEDKQLHATIVIVGQGEQADGLAAYVKDRKLGVPTAVVETDNQELEGWKLSPKASNTVVFLAKHQVHHSVPDLPADRLAAQVAALLSGAAASHSGGHGGHADHHMSAVRRWTATIGLALDADGPRTSAAGWTERSR